MHSESKLVERFEKFNRGEWVQLIRASVEFDEQAAVSRSRKKRGGNDLEHCATRAFNLIQVGEFSSARQALEVAKIALGTEETLSKLTDRHDRGTSPSIVGQRARFEVVPFVGGWSCARSST